MLRFSLVALLAASPAFAAVHIAQSPNPSDRFFERIDQGLRLVRGAHPKDTNLDVVADAGEAWTITVDQPWLDVAPSSGTGPATVVLRFDAAQLNALEGPSAHVTITGPGGGTNVDGFDVTFDIWPNLSTANTPDELRAYAANPANWPKDGFSGAWELWGFLPSAATHPDQPNAGQNVDAWEKTECPANASPTDESCVHPGQAGLATGLSADQAWLLSTGDPRILVAELDSGIKWDDRDLNTKFYLNARELTHCPPPGAPALQPGDDPFVVFDVNHDGVFNIRDYDGAPWLADVNGNGIHDPEDLIWGTFSDGTKCSDGVDDDGNGYVDDIAGWDFFWNDNDPSDDADFGHGTGEANDSTAEAHDGQGTPGICPRCLVMPVRVGDSFITDSNHFADGTVFAVESGAAVVQEALGTINATKYAQEAIDYAYGKNVPIIASMADETSYHHNPPATLEHTFGVHAIVWDDDGENDEFSAHTFLNFNNCTNFGSHLMLSTPGTGCSSEATGKTSGETALLKSYFLQLQDGGDAYYNKPLTAEETYQVLVASADDIDVPGAHDDASALALKKFPSDVGWDLHFGYGRNNVRRALEALRDKHIPAEANIAVPTWFTVFDPTRTRSFDVLGHVGSPRDSDVRWELHVTEGALNKSFVKIAEGTGAVDGKLGTLDLSPGGPLAALVARSSDPAGSDPDQFTATLELRTFAKNAVGETIKGVFRKAFGVRTDPDVQAGFPLYLGASGESSPKLTDVDGDGNEEIVVATSDGLVHAIGRGGAEIPSFPIQIGQYSPFSDALCSPSSGAPSPKCHKTAKPYTDGSIDVSKIGQAAGFSVAIGDLDGAGKPCRDVVIDSLDGFVFAYSCTGQLRAGFPVEIDRSHLPDGQQGARRCKDGNGTPLIGCRSEQQFGQSGFITAPLLVDLDGDGSLEIVVGGMDEWAYAWHGNGELVTGWPVHLENPNIPAFNADGSPLRFVDRIVSSPAVADIFGDHTPMIFMGTNERIDNSTSSFLYGIWPDGVAHDGGPFPPGWPTTMQGFIPKEILPFVGRGNPNSPAAADLDGDGKDEVLCAALGGILQAFGADGSAKFSMGSTITDYGPRSNSKETISLPIISNPSVADLDGDGLLEVQDGAAGSGLIDVAKQGGLRHEFDHLVSAWVGTSGKFQVGFPQKTFDYEFFMNYSVADLRGDGLGNVLNGDGGYFVYAPDVNGDEPPGWPKWTMQWDIVTPAIGDLDGDGNIDVTANTREGWLWAWKTKGTTGSPKNAAQPAIQWEGFHHDDHNTGNFKGPLKPYARLDPADDSCKGGCCCSSTSANAQTTPLAGLVALLAVAGTMRARKRSRSSGGGK